MWSFLIYLIISSVLLVIGSEYQFEQKIFEYLCILIGTGFGFATLWEFFKEVVEELSRVSKEKEEGRIKPWIDLAYAIRGLSESQTELISKEMYLHVEGSMLNDDGILWRVNLPGGTVPLEFIEQFLISSLNTSPYSFPIRDHTHVDFKDFTNVEQMLTITTKAFIYKGWLQQSAGPFSAKLAPGETFERIGRRFGLDIRDD